MTNLLLSPVNQNVDLFSHENYTPKFPLRTLATVFVASSLAFGSASCTINADTAATDTTDMAATDANITTTSPPMDSADGMAMDDSSEKRLAENAMAVPQMSTPAAALKASGLADKATTGGPYTVFAPTNEAFDALPAEPPATACPSG